MTITATMPVEVAIDGIPETGLFTTLLPARCDRNGAIWLNSSHILVFQIIFEAKKYTAKQTVQLCLLLIW